MFEEYDACSFYGIKTHELRAFILDVKEGMAPKSTDIATRFYHTWTHAMDVMHGCYFFLSCCGGRDLFSTEECVALLTAALGHDYGHLGVSNAFLINTKHELAVKYNNVAVQENMHADSTLRLVEKHNFLQNHKDPQRFRDLIKESILHTDMGGHGTVSKEIKGLCESGFDFRTLTDEQKRAVFGFVLHSADLSNPAKPMKLSRFWESRVVSEFFEQGKLEKGRGMSITPNFDHSITNRPDLQFKFLQFVIIPTYGLLAQILPQTQMCLDTAQANQKVWAQERDESLNIEQQQVLRTLCVHSETPVTANGETGRSEKAKRTSRWPWFSRTLESDWWTVAFSVMTIFALFGDDIRLIATTQGADESFEILNILVFVAFGLELALTSYSNIGFLFSFYFVLDLIAWISMITDIPAIWDPIQEGVQDGNGVLGEARNARASRVTRVVRIIRLIRILKLYKNIQKKRELLQKEEAEKDKLKTTQFAFTLKDRDYMFRKYTGQIVDTAEEKALHAKLLTEKNLFQLKGFSKKNKSFQYIPLNRQQIHLLVVDTFNKYEVPAEASDNFCKFVPLNENGELGLCLLPSLLLSFRSFLPSFLPS